MNTDLIIQKVDEFLAELGTSGMVDGDKARNQLLDIRSMLSLIVEVPDNLEGLMEDVSPE